ncbi:MAG: rhomboid family intramembrane serine protease [Phycisphaeraceae bacterium]|nr:rhomboid family intramembrane serine protease [Phycisphaeraceae bacterium]
MGWEDRDYGRGQAGGEYRMGAGLQGMSVVRWLLVINAGVHFLSYITGGVPLALGYFSIETALTHFQFWRWFSYQFLHANMLHLLVNMIGLYFFGPILEQWWGSRRFLAFYLLCGVSGAWFFSVLFFLVPDLLGIAAATPLVGASGSIFGIFAGAAVIAPHQKVMLLFPPIPLKMRTLAIILMAVAFLTIAAGGDNAGGEAAHLGGALLGFLLVRRPWALDFVDRYFGEEANERRRMVDQARKRREREELEKEVDRILAKVKDQGLQSLTRNEQRTLRRASENRSDRDGG